MGFEVLAFPCNQFGGQEAGTAQDIRSFADNYGAQFKIMGKIDVNGPEAHPVYALLKGPEGSDIRWNYFTKFLVQCSAVVCDIYRFDGARTPFALQGEIQKLLRQRSGPQEL